MELHLNARLLSAALSTLDGITCLAAPVVAISICLAAVELCQRLVLVAAPAQLNGSTSGSLQIIPTIISTDADAPLNASQHKIIYVYI